MNDFLSSLDFGVKYDFLFLSPCRKILDVIRLQIYGDHILQMLNTHVHWLVDGIKPMDVRQQKLKGTVGVFLSEFEWEYHQVVIDGQGQFF